MPTNVEPLPDDPATLKAMLLAERVRSERLVQIIRELQRRRFGRRAETLPEDQLLLALEDVEQGEADEEGRERRQSARGTCGKRAKAPDKSWITARASAAHRNRRRSRRQDMSLPPGSAAPDWRRCLRTTGHRAARFRVLVTRRPRYARRSCEEVVAQAPAPARVILGGIPTEATVAHVIVSKYADHRPLYRQAQIYARQGVDLDRSTLADWVGRAAFHLRPVHERLLAHIRASTKIFADETPAPALDPGRGRTKTGQLWAYTRDGRPWGGSDPPAVAYVYAPDRKAERPMAHLVGFNGVLQVDGYVGCRALARKNNVQPAFCWARVRRRFYERANAGPAPIASEALHRIARLYAIEMKSAVIRPISGATLASKKAVR